MGLREGGWGGGGAGVHIYSDTLIKINTEINRHGGSSHISISQHSISRLYNVDIVWGEGPSCSERRSNWGVHGEGKWGRGCGGHCNWITSLGKRLCACWGTVESWSLSLPSRVSWCRLWPEGRTVLVFALVWSRRQRGERQPEIGAQTRLVVFQSYS